MTSPDFPAVITQAVIPIIATIARSAPVTYAEVVSSVPSKSADAKTRTTIDELIELITTAMREAAGGCHTKAIALLSQVDPPAPIHSTVYCLTGGTPDPRAIEGGVHRAVGLLNRAAPHCRLKQPVQFEVFGDENPLYIPEVGRFTGTRISVLMEVATEDCRVPA